VISIRRSTPADGLRAIEIWRSAVDATHNFLSSKDRKEIEAEVVAFLPEASLWLAVDEHDVAAGFMLLDGSRMEALFIHSAHRGRGVGRALVEYAMTTSPELETDVNEQNLRALAFYEHMGFKRTGRSERDGQGRPYPLIHLSLKRA
jgi:putative acetyltransferase